MQVTYTAERSKQNLWQTASQHQPPCLAMTWTESGLSTRNIICCIIPLVDVSLQECPLLFSFFSFSIFSFFLYFVGGVTCHAEPLCKSLCRPALLKAQNKICGKQLLGTLQRLVFISELTLIEQRRLQFGQLIGQVVPLFQQLLLLCF